MEPENLHAGFGVRVICRLEAELVDSHFSEKYLHESNQPAQREAKIRNHAFHLVEFSQMRGIDGFIAENPVDGEVARRPRVCSQLVQHGS